MSGIIDVLLVGKGPLGSALRAAVIGALAVAIGQILFASWAAALIFGLVVSFAILPLAYMISKRDDGGDEDIDPYLSSQDERPPGPAPRDLYSDQEKPTRPGSHL